MELGGEASFYIGQFQLYFNYPSYYSEAVYFIGPLSDHFWALLTASNFSCLEKGFGPRDIDRLVLITHPMKF